MQRLSGDNIYTTAGPAGPAGQRTSGATRQATGRPSSSVEPARQKLESCGVWRGYTTLRSNTTGGEYQSLVGRSFQEPPILHIIK